jgi:hypothetical protein
MIPSLLLFTALAAPAQGGLQLTNVRNTFGELGGARPDAKLFPGDVLFVGFDIEGITIDADGKVQYTMAMEVQDKTGKAIFKQDPAKKTDFVPLGGNRLPGRAYVTIGLDQEAGAYSMKLTVTDNANNATQTFTRPFEVVKKDFAIVSVVTTVDEVGGIPAPTTGIAGQSVFVRFGVVGFDRAAPAVDPKADPKAPKKDPQPNVTVEMQPFDEKGLPTLQKPVVATMDNGVAAAEGGFTMRFLFPMTRAGKYTVRLKATDQISRKTATFDLPMTVLPVGN